MKPNSGSPGRESSPASRQAEESAQYFFPEWVVGVFYGGHWEPVKIGSFKEGVPTDDHGSLVVYEDPFNGEIVFVMEPITGFRVKKPEPIPPPEPKATVTSLFPEK